MKKDYQKPNMEIEVAETTGMLAMSYGLETDKTGGNLARDYEGDFEDEDAWW